MTVLSRYAIASLGIALLVLALKGAAYWATGSIALLSDALESIINVVVAAAAIFAISVSVKPPDANHPFGHYKAEYFSAVLEGTLIIAAACRDLPRGIPPCLAAEAVGGARLWYRN